MGSRENTLQTKSFKRRFIKAWDRDKALYLLALPAIVYTFIFSYIPMYGIQIAFKRYIEQKGIMGSPWVGMANFVRFFNAPQFWDLIRNTLTLSLYGLIAGFPLPIIFALLLNHTPNLKFKKTVQLVTYAPHFISVVVMCGIILIFLAPTTGIVNNLIEMFGGNRVLFMGSTKMFPHIYVWTDVWQNIGWGTIIYTAALSSISPEQYEAAKIDGASKFGIIRYVDLPGIMPTIVTLLILSMGSFMSIGFQKAFLLQNSMNLDASEIISTYVYKIGIINARFDYSTAIGLFNNVINVILIFIANTVSKKVSDNSLW